MEIRRFASSDDAASAAAARLVEVVRDKPYAVIGLPAGRTMVPVYAEIVRLARSAPSQWAQVRTFQVDEFIGLGRGDAGSFRGFLERHLLDALKLAADHVAFLNGKASDAQAECERYERAIAEAGGLDLQLLGIGANGHIGFNEPGDSLTARTHLATLHDETRRANAMWFENDVLRVPHRALSMGMATLLGARTVVLVATGDSKVDAVARAVTGPVTTKLPASFLQLHRAAEFYVDAAAVKGLRPGPGGLGLREG